MNRPTDRTSDAAHALPRTLGPALATSLVVSNVIGVGIFTTSGLLARDLADPRLLLGIWVAGGVMALAGALCYGELGARYPRAGGEYAYLREAYGPLVAFLSGWASLLAGFSAPIAAASLGFTEYLGSYVPALAAQAGGGAHRIFGPGHLVAALTIVALSALHYRRVEVGGSVHLGLTLFKVGVIVLFVLFGFALGRGNPAHFSAPAGLASGLDQVSALGKGMIFVMFSYSGWNAAAYIGGEIREPRRNLPRSLAVGTLIVIVLYLAINALYVYALPVGEMASVIRIAELASLRLFGLDAAPTLNLVFMGTILGSISAMIIAGPRVYYAMARDGVLPEAIGRVHPRHRTPANAILLQAVWSVILLGSGTFEQLLTFSGVVLVLFSALTVGAVWVTRRRGAAPDAYSSRGYPWTMLLFLAASGWILAASVRAEPRAALSGLAVVAAGVPFYFYWRRRDASAAGGSE
jgi:APA family basic amino acid/polyamine antiporter